MYSLIAFACVSIMVKAFAGVADKLVKNDVITWNCFLYWTGNVLHQHERFNPVILQIERSEKLQAEKSHV